MVAIFNGGATGFERGSGAQLGWAGMLGSAALGRGGEQVFANAGSGNLLVVRQDEFLAGRGPDARVGRAYNSDSFMGDDNGDHWQQTTDRRVYGLTGDANTVGSTVKRQSADGTKELFYVFTGTVYQSSYALRGDYANDTLTFDDVTSTWTWSDGDLMSETYEVDPYHADQYRIVSEQDTSGNEVTYGYTGAKLTTISTADGGRIEYTWSGTHITAVSTVTSAATMTRTLYQYDGSDRLIKVIVDLTPENGSDSVVYETNYTYKDATNLLASITQTDGSSARFCYDDYDRIVKIRELVEGSTERVTEIEYHSGYSIIIDPTGQRTQFDIPSGKLERVTYPEPHEDGDAPTVAFEYDPVTGDLVEATDGNEASTLYDYDANGNLTTITDRLGNVVTRTFGLDNRLLIETRTGSDAASGTGMHTTRYVYDGDHRLRFTISAEGRVTEYASNGYGLLAHRIEYAGQVYDVSGLLSSTPLTEGDLATWIGSLSDQTQLHHTLYYYDPNGNLDYEQSFSGSVWRYEASSAQGQRLVEYTYDQAGRLLMRQVAGQSAEHFFYDGLGRLIGSTDINGGTTNIAFLDSQQKTVVTLASGLITTSVYNLAGELIHVTEAGTTTSGDIVNGGTAHYAYDANGRLRVSTDASGRSSYIVYDHVGRKIADVSSDGRMIEYHYDATDRLIATVRYATEVGAGDLGALAAAADVEADAFRPDDAAGDIWTFHAYDAEGRQIRAIDGDGSVTAYEYDASGRLIATTGYANRLTSTLIDGFKTIPPTGSTLTLPATHANDSIARIFYDKDGLILGTLDGEGYLSRIFYDAAGQKVREVAYFTATDDDPEVRATATLNALTPATHAGDRDMRYVYDQLGYLRFVIDGLGHVTENVYESGVYAADAYGVVRSTIAYAGTISPSAYTYAAVRSAIDGLSSTADNRTSWAVYDTAGRVAYAIDASGAVTGFSYDSMGRLTKQVAFATLRATTSLPSLTTMNSWETGATTSADRVTRFYYDERDLRYTVDAEGYMSGSDYDEEGRVVETHRWTLAVAASGWTIADGVTHALGTAHRITTSFEYDVTGQLSETTDGEGDVRRYEYRANGTLAREIAAPGTADESITAYDYDRAGRVTHTHVADGTAEEATTELRYDGLGNIIEIVDANGNSTTRTYDKLGRIKSVLDAAAGTTSYEYDAFGDLVRTTDARGNSSYSYYDRLGRAVTTVDAEKYVTETAYTVFGEIESVTRRANQASNSPSVSVQPDFTGTSSEGATTSFEYDRLGRLNRTIDALGNDERLTLDAFGNVVSIRNKLGNSTTSTFDRRGLITSQTLPVTTRTEHNDVISVVSRFEYDARGNRTKLIEADGAVEQRTTTYEYDKADRLVEKKGDAVATGTAGTSAIPRETYDYDRRGNLIAVADANDARTLFYYDDQDRKIAQIDALGTLTRYTHDANGNLIGQYVHGTAISLPTTAGGAAPTAPSGGYRATTYTYDALDRLKTSTQLGVRVAEWISGALATSVADLTTTYDYDAAGNVTKVTDPRGGEVITKYDKLGRKLRVIDQEGYVSGWLYDADGNVTHERRWKDKSPDGWNDPAVSDDDRITDFTYDKNGRRLTETRLYVQAYSIDPDTGVLSLRVGAAAHSTIAYAYDDNGAVTLKTEANGDYTAYTYDAIGRLTVESRRPIAEYDNVSPVTPTVTYSYDGLDNLIGTVQSGSNTGSRTTTNVYGAGGRLTKSVDALGNERFYFYDKAGQVIAERWAHTGSTYGVEGMAYTRDPLGRVTAQGLYDVNGGSWIATANSSAMAYNAYGDMTARATNRGIGTAQEHFVYDAAGRLSGSNSGDGVWRHMVYDKAGNQAVTIESEGTNLADMTADAVLGVASTAAAGGFQDGITVTFNLFDARGQNIGTRMPEREISASTRQLITTARVYNAFGEVVSETDARGYTTTYVHNSMGRTVQVTRPSVRIYGTTGGYTEANPVEVAKYDISGRLIATVDANGHESKRVLLAGTGHGGGEALVVRAYDAAGFFKAYGYNAYGDLRHVEDELGRDTVMAYDALGRATGITHNNGRTESFVYDQLGRQLTHTDSVLGTDQTAYDIMGRVSSRTDTGGYVTTNGYVWDDTKTSALGTNGAWVQTTTYANGRTLIETNDQFGHQLAKTDLGGHAWTLTYDLAGRMTGRSGQDSATYDWLNTGLAKASLVNGAQATYAYDAAGNRTAETLTRGGITLQNATATFDALGRMARWDESGTAVSGTSASATLVASIDWKYDAVGNIRSSKSSYWQLSQTGAQDHWNPDQDYWYLYDALNRVTLAKGKLVGGAIVRGTSGVAYGYHDDGQRATSIRETGLTGTARVWVSDVGYEVPIDDERGHWEDQPRTYAGDRKETYAYDAGGALVSVHTADTGYVDNGNGTISGTGVYGSAILTAEYVNDLAGRQTQQIDYATIASVGHIAIYDRTLTFNAAGQVYQETSYTYRNGVTQSSTTTNQFGTGTAYGLGAVVSSATSAWDGSATTTSSIANALDWWDGAVVDESTQTGGVATVTDYSYGAAGTLDSVFVDGPSGYIDYTVTFTNDANGQAIARDRGIAGRVGGPTGDVGPHELWYRYGGRQVGYTGNNGFYGTDYITSALDRTAASGTGPFRNGAMTGYAGADFDQSLVAISSYNQGGGGGSYEVQAGDTLAGIAGALWGDSSLWYKLAEANGLGANAALVEGQRLTVPAGVMKNTHNAGTFRPYDPSEVIGDLGPAPKPQGKPNKCGKFGAIILNVLMLAMGNMPGQIVGLATGLQNKYNWKSTAIAAISMFTGGAATGNIFLDAGLNMASNAATQGISVALGLQDKFDWRGVVAAGAGSLAGEFAAGALGGAIGKIGSGFLRDLASGGVRATADGLASAAALSLLNGNSFGDNVVSVLPGVVTRTLGAVMQGAMARREAATIGAGRTNSIANRSFAISLLSPIEFDRRGTNGPASVTLNAMQQLSQPSASDAPPIPWDPYLSVTLRVPVEGRELEAEFLPEPRSSALADMVTTALGLGPSASSLPSAADIDGLLLRLNPALNAIKQVVDLISPDANWFYSWNNWASDQFSAGVDQAAEQLERLGVPIVPRLVRIGGHSLSGIQQGAGNVIIGTVSGGYTLATRPAETVNGLVRSAPGALRAADRRAGAFVRMNGREFVDGVSNTVRSYARGDRDTVRPAARINTELAAAVAPVTRLSRVSALERAVIPAERALAAERVGLRTASDIGFCFVAGTLVHTPSGLRSIEDLCAGDLVLSQPEIGGEREARRIVRTVSFEDKAIWKIEFSCDHDLIGELFATGNHPFWVESVGWTAAEALEPGQKLQLADGGSALIIDTGDAGFRDAVFNLEVDGFHTYYVSEAGVWVHNTNCAMPAPAVVEGSAARIVPNPYGRLGGPAHQAAVAEVRAGIEARGLSSVTEHFVRTPGGTKATRFVDVAAIDRRTNLPVEYYQVGRQTLSGNPVAREVRALDDIQLGLSGIRPTYVPYNKIGH